MPPRKLNSTLESNLATAFIPRFPIFDRLTHLGECIFVTSRDVFRYLCGSRPAPPPAGLRPPGDVPTGPVVNEQLGDHDALRMARPLLAHSRETLEDLPTLSVDDTRRAQTYLKCTYVATKPKETKRWSKYPELKTIKDAFDEKIPSSEGGEADLFLLPKEVRESSLLNKGREAEGEISTTYNNVLIDRKTGFGASIYYDTDNREAIISFSVPGGHGMSWRQNFRGFLQWLGFVPKPFSQASLLTRLVRDHLEAINANLPEEQKIKLTLTGHCLSGSMASYAALRNKVPAVVTNPLRLGNGLRARIGEIRLQEANKYVTEVVVQGDWAADNRWAWLYFPLRLLGIRSFGPLGTARRFMVPHFPPNPASRRLPGGPHSDIRPSLEEWGTERSFGDNLKVFCPWLEDAEIMSCLNSSAPRLFIRIRQMIVKRIGRRYDASVHRELVRYLTTYVEQCFYGDHPHNRLESRLETSLEGIQTEIERIENIDPRNVPGFCREILAR